MKSHVGMGYHLCPICCEKHDEVVLLDRRLAKTLDHENLLGWKLCAKHEEMQHEYVALVEVTNDTPPKELHEAKRTGTYVHIRRSVWGNVFNSPAPPGPLAFCAPELVQQLSAIPQAA